MNKIDILLAVSCIIGGILTSIRQLQMLQQNSYFAVRYLRWYKGSFSVLKFIYIVIALALSVAVGFGIYNGLPFHSMVSVIAFLGITSLNSIYKNKTSIKKLVVTARVKRMFFAEGVILTVVSAVALFSDNILKAILLGALVGLATLTEIIVLATLCVMKPIEKLISLYYINDAKKILKSMKNLKVIGVTGSYGKTSTKFILGRILSERYNTLVTPENYNTPMGIVITVRRDLKPQTEVFICEMGAKRRGDILEDCLIANPDLGIITSVGPQHLETFKNIETVTLTKFELADFVQKKNGTVFLNSDNQYIASKIAQYNSITYGTGDCDCKLTDISYSPNGLRMTLNYKDNKFNVTSRLLGHHNALNIAAASAVALNLGITPDEITFALSKLAPIEHRLELKRYINGATLIDDAYNSNPEGCLEAVHVLGSFDNMKKIIVTPGLVELGDKEYTANKRLGEEAAKYCDIIILVGHKRSIPLAEGVKSQNFNNDNLYIVASFKEAVNIFKPMCDKNTVILFENDLPDNYLE